MRQDPELDVIVCTFNEGLYITDLLNSLCEQTAGTEAFRIILVDNASTDDTRKIVESFRDRLRSDYFYEARIGLNYARNTGLHQTNTEYVAFTDADAKADPRWIETILRILQQEKPHLLGGPYFAYYRNRKPAWYKDQYNQTYFGDRMRLLRSDEYASGINMVWRRETILALRGYDTEVGLFGRGMQRGGETNLIVRARETVPDFKALYCPEMIVYHLTRPRAFDIRYWMGRYFIGGYHHYKIWPEEEIDRGFLQSTKSLIYAIREIGVGVKECILRNRKLYPSWKNYIYEKMLGRIYQVGLELQHLFRAFTRPVRRKKKQSPVKKEAI